MSELIIGLVAEGKTDHIVLRHLLAAHCRTAAPDLTLKFNDLQPNPDGTSGYPDGGWKQVLKWCRSFTPDKRRASFLKRYRPRFADGLDAKRCHVILVHMDADICEQIGNKTAATPVPDATSAPQDRGGFIHQVLTEWLWPNGETPDADHLTAPAVESVETWLVAALAAPPVAQPEALKDALQRLVAIDYRLTGKPAQAGKKEVKKNDDNYERLSAAAAPNVGAVAANCPHFASLAAAVSNAGPATPPQA
jgi:hypothetical protein